MFNQNDMDKLIQLTKDQITKVNEAGTYIETYDVEKHVDLVNTAINDTLTNATDADAEIANAIGLVQLVNDNKDVVDYEYNNISQNLEPLNHLINEQTDYYGDILIQTLNDVNSSISTGEQTVEECLRDVVILNPLLIHATATDAATTTASLTTADVDAASIYHSLYGLPVQFHICINVSVVISSRQS